jgi:hypothetical protein
MDKRATILLYHFCIIFLSVLGDLIRRCHNVISQNWERGVDVMPNIQMRLNMSPFGEDITESA